MIYSDIFHLGVGLVAFGAAAIRDFLITTGPHPIGEDRTFYLVRHDEGPNMRIPVFEAVAWVVFLGFPLEY